MDHEAAFALVANAHDWRAPINAVVSADQVRDVTAAISYYTATEAVVTKLADGRCRVRAVGYRNGPAGP